MARRINADGEAKAKQLEGFVGFAYDDFDPPARRRHIRPGDKVNGTLTIAYGHTGSDVKPGMTVSEAQGSILLRADLAKVERAVDRLVKVPLNDNQFSALVLFALNVGEGAFAGSTLLGKLNAGDYDAVPKELMKWVNSKGKRMQGLVNRRAAEAGLWVKGSFVSSNTIEAKPARVPLLTVDNVVKVTTPATALLQSFTSGPAQIILALAFVAGAAFLLWKFVLRQQEAAS